MSGKGDTRRSELALTVDQRRLGDAHESGLPADLVRLSCGRLALAALIYAIVYLVDYTVHKLAPKADAELDVFPMVDMAAMVAIPLALAMFVTARSRWLEPRTLLTVGLVFEVLAAFGVAIQEHWAPWDPAATVRGISWVCVWIVAFPVLVPSPVRRTLTASLGAAATGPLALVLVSEVRGFPLPGLGVLVDLFEPLLLCALLAPVLSQIVYRLGRELSRARRFGSYELVERLGVGGMGEVWLARHHMLARPAAIKLIRADVVGPLPTDRTALERRFEREAQAIAKLESPHTIQLFDFGVSDSGRFYYVMELLDGLDLETLVKHHGPMPPERAIHLLLQVCHSLRDAHQRGMVHRDVKPANLYVCRKGADDDFVKVLDFGLVKSLGEERGVGSTQTGLLGTPAFLPPELARTPRQVDQRADLYSLGCVAYWLLTGRLVFEADSPLGMLACHLQEPPEPPSRHSGGALPAELDELILRCLQKEPGDRPGTIDEVVDALKACPGHGTWTGERAAEWWASHARGAVEPAPPTTPRDFGRVNWTEPEGAATPERVIVP
jgi:eukaryotic-like serine/threonine-protein kinase